MSSGHMSRHTGADQQNSEQNLGVSNVNSAVQRPRKISSRRELESGEETKGPASLSLSL